MTFEELNERRRHKWHVDGRPVRTLDAAREFMESVGFCIMHPLPAQQVAAAPAGARLRVPSFFAAVAGTDEGIPTQQYAFADPRNQEATELMVRLLREKAAYEAHLFADTNFLVAASVFPFFYGVAGDRNPRQIAKPGTRSEFSPLARDCFELIRNKGPVSKNRLRALLGGAPSDAALDHALTELWSRLRITRVDYRPHEGASWDVLYRWAPDAVREGIQISVPEALSALISKYVDCVIAAEICEIEAFFSLIVARSKVREAVNALIAARELQMTQVGGKTMLRLAHEELAEAEEHKPAEERRQVQPIVPRERRMRRPPVKARGSEP